MTDASAGLGRRARWHRTVEDVNMDLAALDLDKAREFFALRYFGALWTVRAAAPHLRPGRSITLSTGIAGRCPSRGWAVAASICGAVESLTRALAVELAPIRVNAVSPGVVRSPLWAWLTLGGGTALA